MNLLLFTGNMSKFQDSEDELQITDYELYKYMKIIISNFYGPIPIPLHFVVNTKFSQK